jgi:integrase
VSKPGSSASAFSAAGPALGYLAQVDYALLAALDRLDDEDDFAVSIETLDDIVFHDAESDDASTDLWKTLANWIAELGDPNTRLVLLAVANAGPTAAQLRTGTDRDVARAQEHLERTAAHQQATPTWTTTPPSWHWRQRSDVGCWTAWARQERRRIPPYEAGHLLDAVNPRCWDLVLAPFLCGARPEELLALRESDIDTDQELILVHQRATPGGGLPDKPGVLKVGLKERRRLVREEPDVRGRWTLFPRVLHPERPGRRYQLQG